ncbi:MAG TPA: CpsD/CapB family tyrosine-protein kinase [Sphingomicrobium sp.]|nr:CpsD/CapB family tyrosine-protein kinase [Sphingomonas sp.]
MSDPPTSLSVVPIPRIEGATEVPWDPATAKARGIFGFDSMDARSRSFNMIRARLLELQAKRGWRMIGVVSATPKVGKSFISANVSAALSRDPRFHTYVVDLDLRRGSLSDFFGLVPAHGVRDFLDGTSSANFPEAYRLEGERLVIMPTTAGKTHSAELLASERAQTMLRSMRVSDERNLFICDLPPVFANDDAVTVMGRLDGYILVAEEGKTKQREISDAVSLLGEGRLAGVILNKYRGGVISEGYGVDDYYAFGYGQTETPPK